MKITNAFYGLILLFIANCSPITQKNITQTQAELTNSHNSSIESTPSYTPPSKTNPVDKSPKMLPANTLPMQQVFDPNQEKGK